MTATVITTKIVEVERKMSDIRSLVTTTALNTKTGKVEKKYLIILNILLQLNLINSLTQYLVKKLDQAKLAATTDFNTVLVMMVFKICLFINQNLKGDKDTEHFIG